MRALALATAAAIALAACASTASDPAEVASLSALRERFGVPDCPETDPDAGAVPGGLPKTSLPCLGSTRQVNLAGLPRRPMVVNLWAQWCAPCRAEAAILKAVSDEQGVDFYGINYNDPKPDWALEFAALVGWRYSHIQDLDKQLAGPLNVPGLPLTLLVTADGRIAHRHAGELHSAQELASLIEEHL
ncbi:TlpA disulfide reductase family protein [Tessaracoccus sp. OH4464_COT-324]|uniref:TlpA family protein disulfide reductase n=1 Tax=Tessaracoccus sp. OH4464_COT-324 TaxID=2491059 RepID=UPI000F63A4EC|nr:TlpA disulfide reductase family protein [Tessaracoccus sp. OH4464_COT-324]RRD47115.1 TlpA family protein disulfide reductase [Tessaracoccus sp. OH4464_COT-324]